MMRMAFCLLVFVLSGCGTTATLWEKDRYVESVSAFFINDDNNFLIATGNQYAYVFEIDREFKHTLKLSREIEFVPRFSDFELAPSGEISGQLTLSILSTYLAKSDQQQLHRLGFSQDQVMKRVLPLNGHRYQLVENTDAIQLENHYPVKVVQASSVTENAGKVAVTPATVVIDSAVVAVTAIPTAVMFGVLGVYMYAEQP